MNEKPLMFDPEATKYHIGTEIKFVDRLQCLAEIEQYVRSKCLEARVDYSYDCTADENTFYDTINYTTYAGLFIMHPLCFSHQLLQMYDAKADGLDGIGHIEWIEDNIEKDNISKYVKSDGSVLEREGLQDFKAVVVLPGSNKIYEHTSDVKLKKIIERHGSDLVMKPHPITTEEVLEDLANVKGEAQLADPHSNLYDIIRQAEVVYTSHISETALTSLLLKKRVSPMEVFGKRFTGSFSHINHFCFSEPDPIGTLASIFASPKSGVIHPEIDKDWKDKVDKYFEYSLAMRKVQLGHYYQ